MKNRLFVSITLSVLILSAASVASAQEDRPFDFWAGAGFVKLFIDDAPDGSYSVAGGIDYSLHPDLSLGAEVGYFNFGSKTIGGGIAETSFSAVPVTGQLSYNASAYGNIVPYLRGGAGLYHLRASDEGADDEDDYTENEFGINMGGGIKIVGDNTFSYAIEFRYHIAFRDIENWDMIELAGKVIF